jgi:hypothetical protein
MYFTPCLKGLTFKHKARRSGMPKIIPRDHSHLSQNLTQFYNFSIGIILVAIAVLSMYLSESIGFRLGFQFDTLVLAAAGVLSLWAGLSSKYDTVYYVNMALGSFFTVSSLLIALTQFFEFAWFLETLFNITAGDFFTHALVGIAFLANAYQWKEIQ